MKGEADVPWHNDNVIVAVGHTGRVLNKDLCRSVTGGMGIGMGFEIKIMHKSEWVIVSWVIESSEGG